MKQKLSELVLYLSFLAALVLVGWLASQVSTGFAVLAVAACSLGIVPLVHNFDWISPRLVEKDDRVLFHFCESGMVARLRWLYRRLPASPRCRVCLVPFGGLGRLLGLHPSRKSPRFLCIRFRSCGSMLRSSRKIINSTTSLVPSGSPSPGDSPVCSGALADFGDLSLPAAWLGESSESDGERKKEIGTGLPSSKSEKSPCSRSVTNAPFRSVTRTSSV